MGLDYLNICSYWKNLTSPLTCWRRGTTFHFDVMKDHPQTQVVLTDLGADVVIVTMAARIVQSIMSLGKNLLQKRTLYWKMLPRVCMRQALRAAAWVCWSVMDLLLPLLMTTVYVYKSRLRFKAVCNTERPMKCQTELVGEMMVEELYCLKMETVREVANMDCKCEEMSTPDGKELLLPSCTNPVILSMICMPSEHGDSSEAGIVEEGLEGDCSQEDMSVDSGMQESWTPKSKYDEDYSEESDWSDDDSWDEESNSCNEGEDLWASFCRSDDPYNPLSFAMPTRSPEQQQKKEAPVKCERQQTPGNLDCTKVLKIECETVTEKQKRKMKLCKKPVLSGYKSPHNCTLPKETTEESDQGTKKVRFSPKVTVRPIIAWSFAHRLARRGPWEEYARDRSRFQRRVAETEAAISFCLDPDHREKIWGRLHSKQN